jgi:hypothetical protein
MSPVSTERSMGRMANFWMLREGEVEQQEEQEEQEEEGEQKQQEQQEHHHTAFNHKLTATLGWDICLRSCWWP